MRRHFMIALGRGLGLGLVLALALAAPASAQRADKDLPAAPAKHFVDQVGLVSAAEAEQFAGALYGFEQRTGIQFVVAVLPDHGGELQEYTNRLYEHWRIGSRETQRGVLFVVFPDRRETRIEPGYGLEETLPDVVASRILRAMMEQPREPAAGRLAFVVREVVRAVAPDDPLASGGGAQGATAGERKSGRGFLLPLLFFLLFPLIFGGRRRSSMLGPLIIGSMLSGGSGRGGGFGGGGGGGGFSGGGGASGGW